METAVRESWGLTTEGREVGRWTLVNGQSRISVAELGARWLTWQASGRELLVAPASVAAVEADATFMGAMVGRFANRLTGGRFAVGDQQFQVPPNEGANVLHGGQEGFWALQWDVEADSVDGNPALHCTLVSPDGAMGFPGRLEVSASYVLLPEAVRLDYRAVSDADTVINLTNHAYFTLGAGDVRDLWLEVAADSVVAVDAQSLPTGEMWRVDGTDFDLREPRRLGEVNASDDPRINVTRGIDHCYVLDAGAEMAARLSASEVAVEVLTDQPGLQVYCGQYLTEPWRPFQGLCLETQHFPDSPNQPSFPSALLGTGEVFESSTTYRLA